MKQKTETSTHYLFLKASNKLFIYNLCLAAMICNGNSQLLNKQRESILNWLVNKNSLKFKIFCFLEKTNSSSEQMHEILYKGFFGFWIKKLHSAHGFFKQAFTQAARECILNWLVHKNGLQF